MSMQSAQNIQPISSGVKTIGQLIDGYRRFRTSALPCHRARFERLAKGQSPLAIFITCSDSRIQPHLITQASPGDLFVVRNAGNIVPPYSEHSSEGAAIEYAVCALEVPHIIVCGHSGCGAMSGLLRPDSLASLSKVRHWVKYSSKALRSVEKRPFESAEQRLDELVRENVLLQRDQLMTYPFVAERVRRGDLTLHSWVYEIGTGLISEFDSESSRFTLLGEPQMTYA